MGPRGVRGAIAIGLLLALSVYSGGQAQASAPDPAPPAAQPSPSIPGFPLGGSLQDLAPPELREIFRQTQDVDQLAAVHLDGRPLFDVATTGDGTFEAKTRAQEIEDRLQRMARSQLKNPKGGNFEVTVKVDQETNQPVIYVNGEALMTVTYLDAALNGNNSMGVEAAHIATEVRNALKQYYQERQPVFLWRQVRWGVAIIGLAAIATLLLNLIYRRAGKQRDRVKEAQSHLEAASASPHPDNNAMTAMRTQLTLQRNLQNLSILRQVLRLLKAAAWVAAGLLLLGLFPYSRWLQPVLLDFLRVPLRLSVIAFITYGLIRLSGGWIDWFFLSLRNDTEAATTRSQRLLLRLSTFSQVTKGLVAFLLGSVAFLTMLSVLGIRIAPLLAGAGLLGFAISFASQSLIKDFINGFLILLEDQYGVGDVVNVDGFAGVVETMNLRITQLRATEGQLITIPNGQIAIVQNLSKEWSRVDILVPVSLEADINQALQIVESVAQEMQRDRIWGSLILEPPLLLGVDNLDHIGASIRLWIKTLPLKQWEVAREYRRRLKIAFEAAQIPIGIPQQTVRITEAPPLPSVQS